MAKKTPKTPKKTKPNAAPVTEIYEHTEATVALRPDIGTQAQFKQSKPAQRYRYDSSLAPALDWDGQNPAREKGETLIAELLVLADKVKTAKSDGERDAVTAALQEVGRKLKALGKPFLDWAGKAERLSFDVPTLPLFVHERLSTEAIIQTLRGHRRGGVVQASLFDLFADPQRSIADQVLKAYEYRDQWTNRMILGDSLVVMNSLLHYEGLGGQVQMIYMDPPYGIKYGSNFQPFVRRRDVKHNDDDDLTREPEMVQAYRDTWEIGLHSYLTGIRDRLLLCRDLLTPSGSVFVQISDDNLHHVREVMDDVLGPENFVSVITFSKTTGASSELLGSTSDYLLWYARDKSRVKYRPLYMQKSLTGEGGSGYGRLLLADGTKRYLTDEERHDTGLLPSGAKIYTLDNLTSQRPPGDFPIELHGKVYRPTRGYWKTGEEGMEKLKAAQRLEPSGTYLRYVRFLSDFPVFPLNNLWTDTTIAGFTSEKLYCVQTTPKVPQRCIMMTTDPGDLVLDPTCGGATTGQSIGNDSRPRHEDPVGWFIAAMRPLVPRKPPQQPRDPNPFQTIVTCLEGKILWLQEKADSPMRGNAVFASLYAWREYPLMLWLIDEAAQQIPNEMKMSGPNRSNAVFELNRLHVNATGIIVAFASKLGISDTAHILLSATYCRNAFSGRYPSELIPEGDGYYWPECLKAWKGSLSDDELRTSFLGGELISQVWAAARFERQDDGVLVVTGIVAKPSDHFQAPFDRAETNGQAPAGGALKPAVYLKNWREILASLDLKNNDEEKRNVAQMNRKFEGPIQLPPRGGRPKVEKTKLLEWWNSLEERWQELEKKRGDKKSTTEDQYQHGKEGTVVPEIKGHLKKKRHGKS